MKKSKKSKLQRKNLMTDEKNPVKSYIFACVTACLFATSNYLISDISVRLGNYAMWA